MVLNSDKHQCNIFSILKIQNNTKSRNNVLISNLKVIELLNVNKKLLIKFNSSNYKKYKNTLFYHNKFYKIMLILNTNKNYSNIKI